MARAYMRVYFDGKPIRCFGGNNREVRELRYQYRVSPEKYHSWMRIYKDFHKKVSLECEFNR